MPRTKEFDQTQALRRALELFWARGYEATSVGDLVEAMGIGRASLYSTFGSKHDLYLQALDLYLIERDPAIVAQLARSGPALPLIPGTHRAVRGRGGLQSSRLLHRKCGH